jgi:protein-S-isoprenylcysteine O-methyltransferase Ste14
MKTDAAHHSQWEIAEVVFGVPFLISLIVQFVVPVALPPGLLRQVLLLAGIAFIISGIGIIVMARREFARYGQPTDPGQPTSRVITTGVFGLSRNPLYLASVLLFGGLALALNNLWSLAALLISIALCQRVLILPEEKYLTAKFGAEYQAYVATVHRWLGRK